MEKEELKRIVFDAVFEEDGRRKLTCPEAFRIAGEHNVELLEIARICNNENIRLCKCQLGCFK